MGLPDVPDEPPLVVVEDGVQIEVGAFGVDTELNDETYGDMPKLAAVESDAEGEELDNDSDKEDIESVAAPLTDWLESIIDAAERRELSSQDLACMMKSAVRDEPEDDGVSVISDCDPVVQQNLYTKQFRRR